MRTGRAGVATEDHATEDIGFGYSPEGTAVCTLVGIVAHEDTAPVAQNAHDPLYHPEIGPIGVARQHNLPLLRSGPRIGSQVDPDLVARGERGVHATPHDPVAAPAPYEPEEQMPKLAYYAAVYHFTSRFFVCQKISWISSMALRSSFACGSLTFTLHAEHSFAAFQKRS